MVVPAEPLMVLPERLAQVARAKVDRILEVMKKLPKLDKVAANLPTHLARKSKLAKQKKLTERSRSVFLFV